MSYIVTKQTSLYFLFHILYKFKLYDSKASYYDIEASDYIIRLEKKEENANEDTKPLDE